MVINIKRIALLRITFSPSEFKSGRQFEPALFFLTVGPVENQHSSKGARARGGNPGAAGILSRTKANSCYFHVKPAKTENDFLSNTNFKSMK
jgi:hypothetical protein